ncbi:MAG: 3-methyl-2-oxobutanoate hydroxymethyltransferase [Succinivibrionaceae bacterium]|nr:3-methyl-2-oxobutanoate hydroxymethyltransferase [Succinivibrionaceae bacterium]MEE1339314.1 3-methyl-2-oxobutanoate hydroxymethyltransferase [Succinivibrionaceae bacterium]
MSVSIRTLQKLKDEHKKFATITAYDATFASIFDEAGIPAILIGDSLGMTIQGHNDTLKVTIDDMAYHTQNVRHGTKNALVIADMPFMSYASVEDACKNAHKLMQAGANVVKIEGGKHLVKTVETLVNNGIPVCGHVGLTPQSVNVFGGYRIQGRQEDQAKKLIEDCLALEEAGICMIVIECVPMELAKTITEKLHIPTIGIGAGKYTDAQILVMHDAFGFTTNHTPSFAKNFLKETGNVSDAVKLYMKEVEEGLYPDENHSFN